MAMEESKAKHFEKATEAFKLGFQQDVVAYLETIRQRGFAVDDIKDYHEYKLQEAGKIERDVLDDLKKNNVLQDCPECPGAMLLLPVNDKPESQTGDPRDRSVWVCQNSECMETIYNEETADEIRSGGGV